MLSLFQSEFVRYLHSQNKEVTTMGLRPSELGTILLFLIIPIACSIASYRLAMKKGYGQMAAAASVALTLVLAYFNPFLGAVPAIFLLLAPDK